MVSSVGQPALISDTIIRQPPGNPDSCGTGPPVRYLRSPRGGIPGTRMAFSGLTKDREIRDVITYIGQFDAKGRKRADAH